MSHTPRPLDGIDLNLLVTLRALLRLQSVTAAAQHIGQTQPTVSRSLATLRTTFSDPLLVRRGRHMVRTPFADAIQAPLERTLAAIDRLPAAAAFNPRTDTRRFRLQVPELVGLVAIPKLVAALEHDAPNVTLAIRPPSASPLAALLEETTDLVVGPAPLLHPHISVQPLADCGTGWSVLVGAQHPCVGKPLDLDTWLQSRHLEVVLGPEQDRTPIDRLLQARGLSRHIAYETRSVAELPMLLATTRMVVSLPTSAAAYLASTCGASPQPHPLSHQLAPLTISLSWHTTHDSDRAHLWLRSRLTALLTARLRAATEEGPVAAEQPPE